MDMNNLSTIRLELGINAQQIVSQVMINNKAIEQQLIKGIEEGFNELTEEVIVDAIKINLKKEMLKILNETVFSWELRAKITKLIEAKIGERVEKYADSVAERFAKTLDQTA